MKTSTSVTATNSGNDNLLIMMIICGVCLVALLIEMLRQQIMRENNIHSNKEKDIKSKTVPVSIDYDSISDYDHHYLQTSDPILALQETLSVEARDLCENDILHTETIYNYIKHIILDTATPVNFFNFEKISDVMIRCHKLIIMNDNKHFEIRFNIFLKDAQTFIHNHQANFISLCISGGFVHDIFETQCGANDLQIYHKYERIDADTVKYCGSQRGRIQHRDRSIHEKKQIYFLDRDVLHTVCTPGSTLYNELKCIPSCYDINSNTKNNIMKQAVITFVVRSKLKKTTNTTIVSNDFVDAKSTVNAGGKTNLLYDEKIKIIKLLHDSMKN